MLSVLTGDILAIRDYYLDLGLASVPRHFCQKVHKSRCHQNIRLDYQPLLGKMSPHSQRPDPGDGGNRAYQNINIGSFIQQKKWRSKY